MDFIDEKDIMGFKRHKDTGQVSRFVEYGAGSYLESDSEFVGDDIAEGCLAEARRSVEEGMVKGFATHSGCLDENPEICCNGVLSGEIVEAEGAQGLFYVFFGAGGGLASAVDVVIVRHRNECRL